MATKPTVTGSAAAENQEWQWLPLISFPAARLNKVTATDQQDLGNGAFTIYTVTQGGAPATVVAVLGSNHTWEIRSDAPTMRVGAQTYMFATPTEPIPPEIPPNTAGFIRLWNKVKDKSSKVLSSATSSGAAASGNAASGSATPAVVLPKHVSYYVVTLCEEVDPESLGVLEAVLETVSPYTESEKLVEAEQPNLAEFAMAQDAQRFYSSSFTVPEDATAAVVKPGASQDAETYVPVPLTDGSYELGSQQETQQHAGAPQYTSKKATFIANTSKKMASGIAVAAAWSQTKLQEAGEVSKTKLAPNGQPYEVSEATLKRLQATATAASVASKTAEMVVGGVAAVAAAVGGAVAHKATGSKGSDVNSKRSQMASASLQGFAEVWNSMEAAAEMLYIQARDTTATVVEHKYGPSAAEASKHVMNTGGHAANTWWAARKLGVKAIAKGTAKGAAKTAFTNLMHAKK